MTYDTPQIRQFLTNAFSDEELSTFCFDHFPEVYNGFSIGMTKGQKVQLLIEYCQYHSLFPNLAAALQRVRPEQYARYFPVEVGGVTADDTPDQPVVEPGGGAPAPTATPTGSTGSTSVPGAPPQPSPTTAPAPAPAASQASRTPASPKSRRPIEYVAIAGFVVGVFACLATWLVVPEFRHILGLDRVTPTSIAAGPTPTAASTPGATAASTNAPMSTSTPTMTPTPDPCVCRGETDEESLRCLITAESEAANNKDLSLIARIYAADAKVARPDSTWKELRAPAYYLQTFAEGDIANARHFSETITVTNQVAWATSGSSGYFTPQGGASIPYNNLPPSDHWLFAKNAEGCWVITQFEFNASRIPFPRAPLAQEAFPTQKP